MDSIANMLGESAMRLKACAADSSVRDKELLRRHNHQQFVINGYVALRDPGIFERATMKEELHRDYIYLGEIVAELEQHVKALEESIGQSDGSICAWQLQRIQQYKAIPFEKFKRFIIRRKLDAIQNGN